MVTVESVWLTSSNLLLLDTRFNVSNVICQLILFDVKNLGVPVTCLSVSRNLKLLFLSRLKNHWATFSKTWQNAHGLMKRVDPIFKIKGLKICIFFLMKNRVYFWTNSFAAAKVQLFKILICLNRDLKTNRL